MLVSFDESFSQLQNAPLSAFAPVACYYIPPFYYVCPNWAIYQNGIREQEIANRGVATWGYFFKLPENAIKVARKYGSLVQDPATFFRWLRRPYDCKCALNRN